LSKFRYFSCKKKEKTIIKKYKVMAELLNKLLISQTKCRPRHSNDSFKNKKLQFPTVFSNKTMAEISGSFLD